MFSQKSIVVLPFENISSDPENEYFADGVTEEIINALSKIDGLKVTARTSSFTYKGSLKDIRIIGSELGVALALEGSIRKSGKRIRISTQLIRTSDGFQVWSNSFDRNLSDIFSLQDEISLLIADKIRENFGHLEINERLVSEHTQNIDAYLHYLKGRFFQLRWDVENFKKATHKYEASIALDANYYQPYFGLVQCYGLMASWGFLDKTTALDKANQYLKKGLNLKNNGSEAHFALATKSLWVDWKPHQALKHLKQALAINPNDSESLESAAESNIALGKFEDAITFIKKALEVNPHSVNHHFTLGNIYYLQKDYSNALVWFQKSLEIDNSWNFSLQVSACCHVLMNNKKALQKLLSSHPNMTESHLFLQLFDAINHGKVIEIETIEKPIKDVYFSWNLWLFIYAGKPKEAIAFLRESINLKKGQYLNFKSEPLNEPLKELAEYQKLAAGVFDQQEDIALNPSPKTQPLLSLEDQDFYKGKLVELMEKNFLYTSEGLTLREVAKEINLHPNKLSWLINEVLGKNFNEYVNGLRINAFKLKALEPKFQHLSLLGIAHECGFNSKSVFNDSFKKLEGVTPSAWVKQSKTKPFG